MADDIARHNYLELAATPRAPYEARQHVRKILADWGHDNLIDIAELVISELATNALIATWHLATHPESDPAANTPGRIWLDLFRGPTFMVLEVWDASPECPRRQTASPDEEGGRGLALVEAMTEHWGHRRLPTGGKIIWALVASPLD